MRTLRPDLHPFSDDEVLRLAASLDQGSEHPLADAVGRGAREHHLALAAPQSFESGTGIGVRSEVENRNMAIGNTVLMHRMAPA